MEKVFLQFQKGAKEGTKITLHHGFRVGRNSECEIFIDDKSLSKKHTVFQILDKQIIIKDLGSSNGTFVNGKKITKAVLSHNDEVSFGRNIAKVIFEGAEKQAASSSSQTAVESSVSEEQAGEGIDKTAQKKKGKLLKLVMIVFAFLALALVIKAVKKRKAEAKLREPIVLKYVDFHDIKNRYMLQRPRGWKKTTETSTYFRQKGAFDRQLVKFRARVRGQILTFAVDRLEGFSYDTEIEDVMDFSSKDYPRYAALDREKIIQTVEIDMDGRPAVFVESLSFNKKTGRATRFYEVYMLVKDYLIIKNGQQDIYAIPHKTRYIIMFAVPDWMTPTVQGIWQEIVNGFEIIPKLPPKRAVTGLTRSQLFSIYEEKIKRAEYLLDRTTIDVGNKFKALMQYKTAIWIAIEYEDLGGTSKYRTNLIKKTIVLNKGLQKEYEVYKFNIKKGYRLKDRSLVANSAEKIMELFPDPENNKHIEAKREYSKFKKR